MTTEERGGARRSDISQEQPLIMRGVSDTAANVALYEVLRQNGERVNLVRESNNSGFLLRNPSKALEATIHLLWRSPQYQVLQASSSGYGSDFTLLARCFFPLPVEKLKRGEKMMFDSSYVQEDAEPLYSPLNLSAEQRKKILALSLTGIKHKSIWNNVQETRLNLKQEPISAKDTLELMNQAYQDLMARVGGRNFFLDGEILFDDTLGRYGPNLLLVALAKRLVKKGVNLKIFEAPELDISSRDSRMVVLGQGEDAEIFRKIAGAPELRILSMVSYAMTRYPLDSDLGQEEFRQQLEIADFTEEEKKQLLAFKLKSDIDHLIRYTSNPFIMSRYEREKYEEGTITPMIREWADLGISSRIDQFDDLIKKTINRKIEESVSVPQDRSLR